MFIVFALITAQALLGGFDNLWHHEITSACRPSVPLQTSFYYIPCASCCTRLSSSPWPS